VRRNILEPTVLAMAAEGVPYVGVVYAGLMITRDGPKVIEFNARWGDPETELIMPLLKSDLIELMLACLEGRLDSVSVDWSDEASCGVVLASPGYPVNPVTGAKIEGLDDLDDGVLAFHAATRLLRSPEPARGFLRRGVRRTTDADVGMVTDGGRILALVATGPTLAAARGKIYANVSRIRFDGVQFRRDIGLDDSMTNEQDAASEPIVVSTEPAVGRTESATTPQGAPQSQALASDDPSPSVAILMGSESDRPVMDETVKALDVMGIVHEVHVMSAHRTPERVRQFARGAEARGLRVIIAGAGGAAHLPGVIAAQTTLPVIGVPILGSSMMGLDSLLSIVQMPGGVPVATVAVGTAGARNAAYLAAAIVGQTDETVRAKYHDFRVQQSGGELA
jgi:phosphoribosylamine--glycine ligase